MPDLPCLHTLLQAAMFPRSAAGDDSEDGKSGHQKQGRASWADHEILHERVERIVEHGVQAGAGLNADGATLLHGPARCGGIWSGVGGSTFTSDSDLAVQAGPAPPPPYPEADAPGHELVRV